ncbi:unnamed protein product [Pylaiella littoralis]
MFQREVRLYKPMQAFFTENLNKPKISARAPSPAQWQAAREVISVLQDASLVSTQVQGGRHGFVGMAINSMYVLLTSLSESTQDVVSLDPFDGDSEDIPVTDLLPEVQELLEILVDDMGSRGLARAEKPTEKICLMLDPRFKSCCLAVCSNGGTACSRLQPARCGRSWGILRHCICERGCRRNGECLGGSSEASPGAAPEAAAGVNPSGVNPSAGGGDPPQPAKMSRMERIRASLSTQVSGPTGDVDAAEDRADVAEREFAAYMKEAAATNDAKFDLLKYWNARGVDGVDASGNVVAPARWPHLSLLARVYAGVDTTSCQAERNFSALKQVLSDMRAGTLPRKIEQMLLLRLNRHLIPGFAKVEQELAALKARHDANAKAVVAVQQAREGSTVTLN